MYFCIPLSPFDIIVLHDITQEIHIVSNTYRCQDPKNGVSVYARKRFGIFFPLTWKEMEKDNRKLS